MQHLSRFPRAFRRLAIARPLVFAFAAVSFSTAAEALPNGINDSAGRYPFVVEIAQHGRMICSGTVLYPRIVATSAHCLQKVTVAWGKRLYVDEYLEPREVFVRVVKDGPMRSYAVEAVKIAPGWREDKTSQLRTARLPHDLALLVTKAPIAVEPPPGVADMDASALPRPTTVGAGRPGVLVAFGSLSCVVPEECEGAGTRRYLPVKLKDSAACYKTRLDREARLPETMWCLDENVSAGDSGGALLIEDEDGTLRFVGVISAQRGLPPELAAVFGRRESAATSLSANLEFIEKTAESVGYGRPTADP